MPSDIGAAFHCTRCGSEDVLVVMWVELNTNHVIGDYGSWDEYDTKWCSDCGEHRLVHDSSMTDDCCAFCERRLQDKK